MRPVRKKLGEILLEMGAIDAQQLQSALRYQEQWGSHVGRALVESRFCSTADITRALSLQTGHPVIDLDAYALASEAEQALPVKVAERLRVVPLRVEGKRGEVLVIAAEGPASLETIDAVRTASNKRTIVVHLADDEAIERAIGHLYHGRERAMPTVINTTAGTAVPIQNDVMFELEPDAPPPSKPVLLYGWQNASARALGAMLEYGGLAWRVASDEELELLETDDVVIATTLALQANLPLGSTLRAHLVIAGMPEEVDASEAKAVGARLYLRPPFTTERVCGAVRRCRDDGVI
jgi:type IV pilus assembly protein PilB